MKEFTVFGDRLNKKNMDKITRTSRHNGIWAGPIACFLILVSYSVMGQNSPSNTAASRAVDKLHQNLIVVMQNSESLGYQGRYEKLNPVISSNFDTPLIVKVILSRYWKELNEQQKSDFIELFNQLSVSTYASRFDSYSGQRFVEMSQQKLNKQRLLVKTELIRPDDTPVKMDYLMHEKDGQWLIISVIANGVNDLSLKRSEYAAVIKKKGFDGLVKEIQRKIRNMENDRDE